MADALTAPEFPMPRSSRCPFDPPPALTELREKGPLAKVRLWDGSEPWLVTTYAEQRALLGDPRVSADPDNPGYPTKASPGSGDGKLSFIMMDDPEHARLRRMVTGPFAIRKVEALRPAVQKITDDLIDGLLAGPNPVDLVEAFALPLPSLVICELLGVPYADHDFFQSNTKTMILQTATPEERMAASRAIGGYLGALLEVRVTDPRDDLISGIAGRITAGELDHRQATEMALLLLIAGHETTANMIALGTLALLRNPGQLALLRRGDDPKFVAGAVEELLRYLHITHLGRRRAVTEDIEIAGRTVRAGEGLIMANEIGNRDPEAFPDPDRLDLTRDARRHVAFGFGVHQCLGQPLARMELQVVYGTLYKRLPDLKLAIPFEDVRFKDDAFVYGVHSLPVTW
ncbi:cytochrome P450 [Streptomyces acidiscabies]|uniref:Cytochrome P450 n=1 Tax=Streptomyces acidiscabies TaxID=42234 RepID=A0AAP6BDJ2_9ACTN|nr:cytochrome P450 [Streptomyces acidiscabies]MBP5934728.1 cytochrome P450 [Streptomyces sp. LBUM 1476]MBZ3917541.1 cytochrome P450 [Streptomyces acidiscabies]MDX2962774.1 cytochrome P450 [Streptomyces acidiscabies]MDX3018919.1 cytochrome P450 [Streptomyces acidiscabies]MDX3790409.1 cytochrome P450 [Streptomyces acidiscabies]